MLVVAEGLHERSLGKVALGQDRQFHPRPHRLGSSIHRLPTGEQRQRAATGGGDQRGQLVVHRRPVGGGARVGHVDGAVQQRMVLVVEWAADVDLVVFRGRQADTSPERSGNGGARQYARALRPDAVVEDVADFQRSDLQARIVGPTADERDEALAVAQGKVDAVLQSRRQLLATHLAGLRVLDIRLDGAQRVHRLLHATAHIDEHVLHGVWERAGQPLSEERHQRVAYHQRRFGDRADELWIVEDALQSHGEGGEAATGDLHADGVAHDVFELMRLVHHDDVVFG